MNIPTTGAELFSQYMDKAKRREILNDPRKYARELGIDVEGKEVVATVCPKDTFYFPIYQFPADGGISQDDLKGIVAAGSAFTMGTGGTASTIATAPLLQR